MQLNTCPAVWQGHDSQQLALLPNCAPCAAQYKPDTFEGLAHRQTVDKLVKAFGYPAVGWNLMHGWGGLGV